MLMWSSRTQMMLRKPWNTWMEARLMVRRSRPQLCWPHGLGHLPDASAPPGGCCRRRRCGAGHPLAWGGGPGLLGADPPFAGDPDPGLPDEGAIAAAPAQTPQDKAKGLDSFLLFNLNPIRWNIVPFFYNESGWEGVRDNPGSESNVRGESTSSWPVNFAVRLLDSWHWIEII